MDTRRHQLRAVVSIDVSRQHSGHSERGMPLHEAMLLTFHPLRASREDADTLTSVRHGDHQLVLAIVVNVHCLEVYDARYAPQSHGVGVGVVTAHPGVHPASTPKAIPERPEHDVTSPISIEVRVLQRGSALEAVEAKLRLEATVASDLPAAPIPPRWP